MTLTFCRMIQVLHAILLLPLFLQTIQLEQSDDLLDSPLFDTRRESKSLQELKSNIESPKRNVEGEKEAKLKNEETSTKESNLDYIKHVLFKFLSNLKRSKRKAKFVRNLEDKVRNKRKEKSSSKPKWHKWTDWSTCSVTCGKGRVIRWRHCQDDCDGIETEMEEIACQLPECPRKLFGMIKLNK